MHPTKAIVFAILWAVLPSPVWAQEQQLPIHPPTTPETPKPEEKPRYEWREFAIADLHKMEFDTWDGSIRFTVHGETYEFQPRTDERTAAPTDVTAGAAVLAELRRAERVRIPILILPTPPKVHSISRWILKYADPK